MKNEIVDLQATVETERRLWDEGLGDRISLAAVVATGATVMYGLSAGAAYEMYQTPSWPAKIAYGAGFVIDAFVGSAVVIVGGQEAIEDFDQQNELRAAERRLSRMQAQAVTLDLE